MKLFMPGSPEFVSSCRWWVFYTVLLVITHVVLSSIGAFFHFLLDHEISLVEGWLHNNGWELAVSAKVGALWLVHRLLRVRLYRPPGVREFLHQRWRWPDQRSWIISIFVLTALLLLAAPLAQPQNRPYFNHHMVAFVGATLWFFTDYFCAALLEDLFPLTDRRERAWRVGVYLLGFWLAFRLTVPDYFHTSLIIHLHFLALLLLAGSRFQQWTDAAIYTLLVAAPLATLFGVDPIWGADFAPFKLDKLPAVPFLLVIWVLSWAYYRYRHRWRWPLART